MVEQQGFDFDPAIHHQPPPVVPLRPDASPPRPPPRLTPQQAAEGLPSAALIDIGKAIRTILTTRVLLMASILVASLIWGLASWQPTELRIAAASIYSVLVLWPLVWLYFRKG